MKENLERELGGKNLGEREYSKKVRIPREKKKRENEKESGERTNTARERIQRTRDSEEREKQNSENTERKSVSIKTKLREGENLDGGS